MDQRRLASERGSGRLDWTARSVTSDYDYNRQRLTKCDSRSLFLPLSLSPLYLSISAISISHFADARAARAYTKCDPSTTER